MTDEAPKRKLLTKEGGLPTGNYPKEELVEYLRADHVRALVAEERDAIAKGIEAKIGPHCHPDSITAMAFHDLAKAIRARTDEDAEKALADLLKAERKKALRIKLHEAANKIEAKCRLRGQYELGQAMRDTILALSEKETDQ